MSPLSGLRLRGVVDYVAALPEPSEYIEQTAKGDLPDPESAERALAWFIGFVNVLRDLKRGGWAGSIAKGA